MYREHQVSYLHNQVSLSEYELHESGVRHDFAIAGVLHLHTSEYIQYLPLRSPSLRSAVSWLTKNSVG